MVVEGDRKTDRTVEADSGKSQHPGKLTLKEDNTNGTENLKYIQVYRIN